MKRTPKERFNAVAPTVAPDFDDDQEFFREVYSCDWRLCESEIAYRLKVLFEASGYKPKKILAFPTHPVWEVRAKRTTALRIADYRLFFKHIQKLLGGAGFKLST